MLPKKLRLTYGKEVSAMPKKWETDRVFISSTFRDMQAERDYLVRSVFPDLCERLGLEFFDVDPAGLEPRDGAMPKGVGGAHFSCGLCRPGG